MVIAGQLQPVVRWIGAAKALTILPGSILYGPFWRLGFSERFQRIEVLLKPRVTVPSRKANRKMSAREEFNRIPLSFALSVSASPLVNDMYFKHDRGAPNLLIG